MPRSARMRSSLSCSTASLFCRSMSLTFSCIRCRAGKRKGMGRAAHLWHGRRTGSIGVSVGSIVFCGCCLSSACPCISMCVVFLFFPSPILPHCHPIRTANLGLFQVVGAYIFHSCRPRGVPLLQSALLPCGMALRIRMLGCHRPRRRTHTSRSSTRWPRLPTVLSWSRRVSSSPLLWAMSPLSAAQWRLFSFAGSMRE